MQDGRLVSRGAAGHRPAGAQGQRFPHQALCRPHPGRGRVPLLLAVRERELGPFVRSPRDMAERRAGERLMRFR